MSASDSTNRKDCRDPAEAGSDGYPGLDGLFRRKAFEEVVARHRIDTDLEKAGDVERL